MSRNRPTDRSERVGTSVLHVLYQSLPDISGSSIRSRDLMRAQQKMGVTVCAITSPFQRGSVVHAGWECVEGVGHFRTWLGDDRLAPGKSRKTVLQRLRKVLALPAFAVQILRVARAREIEVIHAHAMAFCGVAAWLAARVSNKKFVYEMRSAWFVEGRAGRLSFSDRMAEHLERWVARRADGFVVISEGLRQMYVECDPKVVGNAIDEGMLSVEMPAIASDTQELVFGYVGSVIPLEGLDLVLRAFLMLRARGIRNRLIVVGGGVHESECRQLISESGLEDVEMRGRVSPSDVVTAYREMDVIINYRRNEPVANLVTPLKPLEAMALRRVSVVSDVTGMTELVRDGITGIVVPSESPQALADALAQLIASPSTLEAIAQGGYEFVKSSRTWASMARGYLAIYDELRRNEVGGPVRPR